MEFNSGFKGLIQYTRNGGNAIPKHAGPEAEGSNPTTGLTLFWAHNPFGGNFNHWQVSRKEAGQIFVIYSYNKSQQETQFLKFIFTKNSACF